MPLCSLQDINELLSSSVCFGLQRQVAVSLSCNNQTKLMTDYAKRRSGVPTNRVFPSDRRRHHITCLKHKYQNCDFTCAARWHWVDLLQIKKIPVLRGPILLLLMCNLAVKDLVTSTIRLRVSHDICARLYTLWGIKRLTRKFFVVACRIVVLSQMWPGLNTPFIRPHDELLYIAATTVNKDEYINTRWVVCKAGVATCWSARLGRCQWSSRRRCCSLTVFLLAANSAVYRCRLGHIGRCALFTHREYWSQNNDMSIQHIRQKRKSHKSVAFHMFG